MARGTSCVMDILDRASGELVGTAGFRSVVEGHADFGIVVHREWQRAGVCLEPWWRRKSFVANAVYAAETLDCAVIAAATLETNGRVRAFLAKAGLKHVRTQSDHAGSSGWWTRRPSTSCHGPTSRRPHARPLAARTASRPPM